MPGGVNPVLSTPSAQAFRLSESQTDLTPAVFDDLPSGTRKGTPDNSSKLYSGRCNTPETNLLLRGQRSLVDTHARAHGAGHGNFLQILTLGSCRLGLL